MPTGVPEGITQVLLPDLSVKISGLSGEIRCRREQTP
jgi:hypothetical protein